MSKYRPTLCFDFDGVIHSYTSGWQGIDNIPDAPVEGISEAIQALKRDYKITILSTRCSTPAGIAVMKEWLRKYNIYYDEITKDKPPAVCYIDDRAVRFDGNVYHLIDEIVGFKPWYQREQANSAPNNSPILDIVSERVKTMCERCDLCPNTTDAIVDSVYGIFNDAERISHCLTDCTQAECFLNKDFDSESFVEVQP